MVDPIHFIDLEQIVNEINTNNIIGDIIECGVWKGGCIKPRESSSPQLIFFPRK